MLGMIGSAIGAIGGGIMGMNQTHQQYQNQKELMDKQQQQNKELGYMVNGLRRKKCKKRNQQIKSNNNHN